MIYSAKLPLKVGLFYIFLSLSFNNYASFLDEQLRYSRVKKAYQQKEPLIRQNLEEIGMNINNFDLYLRVFKTEQIVRVYVKKSDEKVWNIYSNIRFNCTSGVLGPKRKEGDYQIPEGFYHFNHFNPYSSFLLSLGVSYPNKSDRIKSRFNQLGGSIYMHGGCATIGCIPIEDEPIKELYILAVLAKNYGQSKIPIHIFPFEYSEQNLGLAVNRFPQHEDFWSNIFTTDSLFRAKQELGAIKVNAQGDYQLMQN